MTLEHAEGEVAGIEAAFGMLRQVEYASVEDAVAPDDVRHIPVFIDVELIGAFDHLRPQELLSSLVVASTNCPSMSLGGV